MKIAILGTENSHAYAFANLVKNNAKYKDVEIVGVYGYDENANKKLVDEGLVSYVAKDPHEFVGKVDGIMVTARHGDHHHEYALPYVKEGKFPPAFPPGRTWAHPPPFPAWLPGQTAIAQGRHR